MEFHITTKKHRSGGKYTGSHTTVIGEAIPLLKLVEEAEEVKKISIGLIKNTGRPGSPLRISARALDQGIHGLRVTVNKGGVHQIFRLYLVSESSTEEWISKLEALSDIKHGKRGKKIRHKRSRNRRNHY